MRFSISGVLVLNEPPASGSPYLTLFQPSSAFLSGLMRRLT